MDYGERTSPAKRQEEQEGKVENARDIKVGCKALAPMRLARICPGASGKNTKTYEDGLKDAWELAKKLFADFTDAEIDEIFGACWTCQQLMEMSPQEAMQAVRDWENAVNENRHNRICGGDIVTFPREGKRGVVTKVTRDQNCRTRCVVMFADGSFGRYSDERFVRTGAKANLGEVFSKLGPHGT